MGGKWTSACAVYQCEYTILAITLVTDVVLCSLETVPNPECLIGTCWTHRALPRTEAHLQHPVLVSGQLPHFGQGRVAPHSHLMPWCPVGWYQCPVFSVPSQSWYLEWKIKYPYHAVSHLVIQTPKSQFRHIHTQNNYHQFYLVGMNLKATAQYSVIFLLSYISLLLSNFLLAQ